MSEEERLDEALGALSEHDVGTWRRERIRQHAHEALGATPLGGLALAYHRFFEPALVAAVCVVHLAWAFGAAAQVLLR